MKTAGIASYNGQIILAVIIDNSVHIYRVKTLNDAKDILNTSKPEVVAVDKSASEFYEDLEYGFNTVKFESSVHDISAPMKKLTPLNILKDRDRPAIAAAYYSIES